MFVCEKCCKEWWDDNGWKLYKSYGPCESCGEKTSTWEFKPFGPPKAEKATTESKEA